MQELLKSVSRIAGAAAVVLLVLYPFAAYLSLRSFRPGWLAGLLIGASVARLLAAGVVVRDLRSLPGLGAALRITVGTPAQDDRLLAALRAAVAA